jgi:hypothetical protein
MIKYKLGDIIIKKTYPYGDNVVKEYFYILLEVENKEFIPLKLEKGAPELKDLNGVEKFCNLKELKQPLISCAREVEDGHMIPVFIPICENIIIYNLDLLKNKDAKNEYLIRLLKLGSENT